MDPTQPRIPPLPPDEWDERLTELMSTFPGGVDEPMNIFATLARQPGLFRRWLGFGGALLGGQLAPRMRELVILRTAHRFDGDYEWAHHIALGRAAGVTEQEMAALGGDLSTAVWSPFERAVLAAVDETADEGGVTDRTWSMLAAELSQGDLVELLMLIAHYMMLSTVLRSLGVQLEPSAKELAASVPRRVGGAKHHRGPRP